MTARMVDMKMESAQCSTEKEKVWNPPPLGQVVNSICPYLMHLGFLRPIFPNTNNVPIDFKNGFFKGKALFVVNKKPFQKDYTFEVQVLKIVFVHQYFFIPFKDSRSILRGTTQR